MAWARISESRDVDATELAKLEGEFDAVFLGVGLGEMF